MKIRRFLKKGRRQAAGFVAAACLFLAAAFSFCPISLVSRAATFHGTNIWSGGSETLFGKSRNYMYRWTDGYQMTFCISPGKHMGGTVVAGAEVTTIEDKEIPYVASLDAYEKLSVVCTWFDHNGTIYADNATYAAAQTAVWAIMNDGWESADALAEIVNRHVAGTAEKWQKLKAYVENDSIDIEGLPEWVKASEYKAGKNPIRMNLVNGVWTVELDISGAPQMAALDWKFEGDATGWSKRVSDGKLIFTYSGSRMDGIQVYAELPQKYLAGIRGGYTLCFFVPKQDQNQAMVAAGPSANRAYLKLSMTGGAVPGGSPGGSVPGGGGSPENGGMEVKIYEHRETFLSHYLVDLDKYCVETKNPLKGACFRVLEAFDESQVTGNIQTVNMTPKPSVWQNFKVCAEDVTDENGHISHVDVKRYNYCKTYCDGHPEPDYLELPDWEIDSETGEDNSDEIAAVAEENERLRAQWEALVEECEGRKEHFHGINPGEGLEKMLEDRKEAYEQFIRLEYDYTFQEIQARYGYIRHGQHRDDIPIPVIRVASSEAGGGGRAIDREVIVDESVGYGTSQLYDDMAEWEEESITAGQDNVEPIEPKGDTSTVSFTYRVENHRTEGELHINKRDRELLAGEDDDYNSYGDTQGDATLEGAVYGLYAAEDIVHPDGKTGVVYEAGMLTAIGTTDKNGDASFMAYTEESAARPMAGHPLIPGRYCVREIARSEGYELTVPGETGYPEMPALIGRANVTTAMTHPVDMHDGSWLEFDVACQDTARGFDILISGFPEGSSFFRSRMNESNGQVEGGVVVGTRLVETGEFEKAEAGEYRLDENGSYIPQRDEDGTPLYDRSKPVSRTYYAVRRLNYYPKGEAVPTVDPEKWEDDGSPDLDYVKSETNHMLEQTGYSLLNASHGDGAQWTVLELEGSTNQELIQEILDWFRANSFWDSGVVRSIRQDGGVYTAVIFHDYTRRSDTAIYEEGTDTLYVKVPVETDQMGLRHMFIAYEASGFVLNGDYVTVTEARQPAGSVIFPEPLEDALEPVYEPLYEQYEGGEDKLDGQGNPIPVYQLEYIYEEKEEITSDYELTLLEAFYDPDTQAYRIHVDNEVDWSRTDGPVIETFRAVAPEKTIDINGREMFFNDYLVQIKGVGASAFAAADGSDDWKGDFAKWQRAGIADLTYPGQVSPGQDGPGTPGRGTREFPFPVEEAVIRQPVKVMKDVRGGDDIKQKNFRFKAYLKSNLERLYRDENGQITWIDRKGQIIDILPEIRSYPGLVPDVFTLVPRRTEPLYKDTAEAIEANLSLYDENQEEALPGYTAVLETREGVYDYEKFFHALRVANHDLWDDGTPTYTSHRPAGNEANRSEASEENEKASDMVRQFAVRWYLEGEAKKLTGSGEPESYGDQNYDEALRQAIIKAENYLKPFFTYDLDEIYAIEWDKEEDGGRDGDRTTVSADQEEEYYCFDISESLPYGTYVVAEQQPEYAKQEDYPNRLYETDNPKEIEIPSVYEGTEEDGEILSSRYIYRKDMTPEEMTKQYQIRFCEESDRISAHGNDGDFQIYKYGLALDKISNGENDVNSHNYFALTQDPWKPYQNYYNSLDDRSAGPVTYYLAEGADGREKVGQVYRYSSVSEQAGETDGAAVMVGMTAARDGAYSAALVPRSPERGVLSGEAEKKSVPARVRFRNEIYKARLRIEKIDSETGENLLHDGALFQIYKAECDGKSGGAGQALFYQKDTVIAGSREFLESMGASDIRPVLRGIFSDQELFFARIWRTVTAKSLQEEPAADWNLGNRYTGLVSAGTPVCQEKDQVFQTDAYGIKTGLFASFTTTRDGPMEQEGSVKYGEQNTGYLTTPQPLEAGVYVLAEAKAPAGYSRCRPVAVEVYSDEVTYYRKGDQDERVAAVIYENRETARIYVENEPTRLKVEKLKEGYGAGGLRQTETVTYKISGRIDGSLAQIGGNPNYEYAYQNGRYMGYAWKKGTLEYLKARKDKGEQVEIVYHGGLFAGYGYITGTLETSDDENPYVTGAVMALFEGIPILPSGDAQDYAFEGLCVERKNNGTVNRMYVKKGYAGSGIQFVETQKDGKTCWSAETVQRDDTDILYYDLGGLELFQTESVEGRDIQYGFGRNHEKLAIDRIEEDKALLPGTDGIHSIFAFRGGQPVLELTGGDFTAISYSSADRILEGEFARPIRKNTGKITISQGVTLYHLDKDGNRDSLVDPYTGMAYTVAGGGEEIQILVWPVKISRDEDGRILGADKIMTSRIAAVNEDNPGQEYLTGSWKSENGEESHLLTTIKQNRFGQNMNEEQLTAGNNGAFNKELRPVYDEYGLPVYYQKGDAAYERETDLYDRSGSLIRRKESDFLENYNLAAYTVDAQTPAVHRQGEGYILENMWFTGESSPNDPFAGSMTDGQADILKRVPAGAYIMEEIAAPEGYLKGFPTGVIVKETGQVQQAGMEDAVTKIVVNKIDGSGDMTYSVYDMGRGDEKEISRIGSVKEGKGGFGFTQTQGAELALYEAERVYTTDLDRYPSGTYLRKKGNSPLTYLSTDSLTSEPKELTAHWTTAEIPLYLEGIPAGLYLLEEIRQPDGFVSSEPVEVVVRENRQVQAYTMYNDHTKVEVEKYTEDESSGEISLVNGAEFALYEVLKDETGQLLRDENGQPVYDDEMPVCRFVTGDGKEYAGFISAFEDMYRMYGTEGRRLSWQYGNRVHNASYISHTQIDSSEAGGAVSSFPTTAQMIFRTEEGIDIRITIYQQQDNRQGKDFVYEYQFDYRSLPEINEKAVSYMTVDGMRRFDYLPVDGVYVLKETKAPDGFGGSEPLLIKVRDMADVQRYRILNEEGILVISKVISAGQGQENDEPGIKELPGAHMALYRAGEDGELVQDDRYLAARWISGRDGRYTELDRINRRIPGGYQEGDLKPHTLRRLPEGDYWLVELESPDYYRTFQPVKIQYHLEDSIRMVRVSDEPAEGEVEVRKTDTEAHPLTGAVFQLSAYRKPDFAIPIFVKTFSDSSGTAKLSGLPAGEIQPDGSIVPYSYRLRELTPPEGYAADGTVYSFEFSPDGEGTSYKWDEYARYQIQIPNEKTRIVIQKRSFAMPEAGQIFVEGARLAVYRVLGTDQEGNYIYTPDSPEEQWVTSGAEPDHVLEGLTAGQTYILAELEAPEGYMKMEPMAFTLSEDGKRIAAVSSRLSVLTVYNPAWITVKGRYGIKTLMEVTDEEGNQIASWVSSGQGYRLTEDDGIKDGGIYTFTEKTVYSDGSREITGRVTKRVYFQNGEYLAADRVPEKVYFCLKDSENGPVRAWYPTEEEPELTIGGPEAEEAVLKANGSYLLEETTFYSDGANRAEIRFAFKVNERGFLRELAAYDQKRRILISKTDITGEKEIPGASLQILDEQGDVIEEWISGSAPHIVEAELLPGDRYTLRETLSPKGYGYAADISFTVEEDGSVQQTVMEDKETVVVVTKTDITGSKEVPGACLQILDKDGNCLEEWISGTTPHEVRGKLAAGETYVLHEKYAPSGYSRGEDIEFTVSLDGAAGRLVMKNEKLPERKHRIPADSEPERRFGIVIARYQTELSASDGISLGPFVRVRIPSMGDSGLGMPVLVSMIVSFIIMVFLWKKKKKGMLCVALLLLLNPAIETRAETVVQSGDREITVTYDVITGEPEESDLPAEYYFWKNQEYRLKEYQLKTVESEGETELAVKTMSYEEVEQAMKIPETVTLSLTEDPDGGSRLIEAEAGVKAAGEAVLSKEEISYENWRWIPGFQFDLAVKDYDTGSFSLGDQIVAIKEERPFEGYEKELLELIGVDPEYYRIESVQWVSEPWTGEDGAIYRQAVASGQKYVADVEAVYRGTVPAGFSALTAYEAVYELPEPAIPAEAFDGSDVSVKPQPEAVEIKESPRENPGGFFNWIRNLNLRTKLVLGLGILFLPLALIWLARMLLARKKRQDRQ